MTTVFLYAAAIGGSFMVLQFVLLALGAGGDHDVGDAHVDAHTGHDQGGLLKLLSLQAIATFATFFGLVGLACTRLEWSPLSTGGTALLAGTAALFFVAHAMRGLHRLQSSGTIDLQNAIGEQARVYLHVPADGHGHGAVLVDVQGRTIECRAISRGRAIPTGALARVVDRADGEVLVVEPQP